ncbi:MAG: HNH endonuclease [Candidatus Vecturithrix sp.]|jgi:5-methylcytosine-specific restriction endonuclease McrA|nr:HNH endonuclease [Candidatus Vecturithrix sp.]
MNRQEAIKLGLKTYQGKDCPLGHGGDRYVTNFGCVECLKLHCQKYHFAHHDKNLKRLRDYAKKYPAGNNDRTKRYFDRKCKAIGRITPDVVSGLKAKQENKCFYCGKILTKYHVDHKIPLTKGGSNLESNLCVTCVSCNLSKGTKLIEEWLL